MTPTTSMLLKFAACAVAGAAVGYGLASKHKVQGSLLGATAVMMIYGVAREKVIQA